ncbi:DUF2809 domain-containing protein [Arthrobacter sp. LAPM80]|uniref:DUF2809 domain-containing protein n=1 Tax=Arthrobacter sp. LAPM80 TaxID=3141788 RepID=UPI00398AD28A
MDEPPGFPLKKAAHPGPCAGGTARRRMLLAAVGAGTVMLGLAVHFLVSGDLASLAADALYTVLLYLLLAIIAPRTGRHWLALSAFALSALIELAQLTGIPGQLAVSFPPSSLVLGTTFSAPDLVAYAVGAVAVYLADRFLSARASGRGARWRATQPE